MNSSLVRTVLPKSKLNLDEMNSYYYHLIQFDWSLFGTLTFKHDYLTWNTRDAANQRQKEFLLLLNSLVVEHGLRHRKLLYYGKSEFGANGRGHYNFLLGRDGTRRIAPEILADSMHNLWTRYHDGRADIVPFRKDILIAGVAYQSKYEFDKQGNWITPNELFSPKLETIIKARCDDNQPF